MSDTPQGEGWWQASDGKWYPPTSAAPPPPAAAGKSRGGCLKWIGIGALALVVIVVIAAVAGGGGSKTKTPTAEAPAANAPTTNGVQTASRNQTNPPTADVTVTKCEKGDFGSADIEVTITNHSSKRSNYLIQANLENDSGTKLGEANGASNNVDPGQQANEKLFGTANGEFTKCKITEVNRYSSNG